MLDIFLPNEVEACGLTGASTPDEALNQLAARYPSLLIILSVGAEGALAARGAQRSHPRLLQPDLKSKNLPLVYISGVLGQKIAGNLSNG
jgi:hypothetical protein